MGNFYQGSLQAFEQGGQEQTMARITVEDCLNNVDNRFQLIHLAAKRVRQLKKGAAPMVVCKNKDIVVALREIAAGDVFQAGKGQIHDRIEAPSETDSISALEQGLLTDNGDDVLEPEMDQMDEGVFGLEMDGIEEEEDLLGMQIDEMETGEDVLDREVDEIEEEMEEK